MKTEILSIMESYMVRKSYLVCSAGLLLAIAACDQSTGPSTTISQAAVNKLAADMDAASTLGPADVGLGTTFAISAPDGGSAATLAAAATPINNSFTVTKQCPKGGQVVIAGTITGTGDPVTRSLSLNASATRTDTNCAFDTDDGVLTLNGNPNIVYAGKLNIVNGALSGPQTQTHKGSFKWARTGGSGTCDVDLSSSYDPATHTATVTGTFCGKIVNVTRTR